MTDEQTLNIASAQRFAASIGPVIEMLGHMVEAFRTIAAFRIPGVVLVRSRLHCEIETWGVPEPVAFWLAWRIPYRYAHLIVRVLRHDRYIVRFS